jgi:SPP1 gp7 family putative phage head morphogenesis protein
MAEYEKMSDRLLEKVVNGVYKGKVTPENLPPELYNTILDRLTDSILDGFGPIAGDDDAGLMLDYFRNINVFSAAKTHQQIKDMSSFLVGPDGNKLPFAQFKEQADAIFGEYNENWLKTEQNTAFGLAQAGRKWKDIERDAEALPLLRFETSGDDRVRNHHKSLDGIVKPVGDPFWDKYFPPLDWNCRCITIQLEEDEEPETDLDDLDDLEEPSPLFAHNPAKSRYIFDEDAHPYFKVEDRYKNVKIEGTPIKPPKRKTKPTKLPKEIAKKLPIDFPEGGFKTREETIDFLKRSISKNSGIEIKPDVVIHSKLTKEGLNARVEALTGLFKEYKLSENLNIKYSKPTVSFKSTRGAFGFVSRNSDPFSGERQIFEINVGHETDKIKARLFNPDDNTLRPKSRVDPENIEIATTVHEFAHIITVSQDTKGVAAAHTKEFFKRLKRINRAYKKELVEVGYKQGDLKKMNELYLGKYAETNLSELMAEGFAEYKLSSNPSKYAVQIGELIDEFYKK